MVKVRVEVPFTAMLVELNDLAMVGGNSTARLAEAVPPVPPLAELTLPVVFVFTPDVPLVTLTDMAQLLLVLIEPPVRLRVVSPGFGANVPPQVLVAPGVAATLMPPGNGSLTATPLCATVLAEGLVMVMVSVEVPFIGMLAGLKALVMVGADTAAKIAEAAVPVPPLLELTVPVVLFRLPAVVAVTFTDTLQLPPTGIDPPVRLSELPLAVKVPPQVLLVFGVLATVIPVGSVSLTATPVSASVLAAGLVMVSVSVELEAAPTGMLLGANALVMVGGASTVRVAEALVPIPPLVDVRVPVVLVKTPPAVAVTFMETVQLPPAPGGPTDPPLRLKVVDPEVTPVTEPPHVFTRLGGFATCMGVVEKLSLTARPVRATVFAAGLVIVSVRVEVPPTAMVEGENDFAISAGISTARLAVAVPPTPPFAEVTAPVVLTATPDCESVTFTEIVQLLLALTVAPVRLMPGSFGLGEKFPPQVLLAFAGEATTMGIGKVSLTPTPVCATRSGLVMVSVSVVVPFTAMLAGVKLLVMVNGPITLKVADAVAPVPWFVELTVPVVFWLGPEVELVTTTEVEQAAPVRLGSDAPLRLMEPAPPVAVNVPPQVLTAFGPWLIQMTPLSFVVPPTVWFHVTGGVPVPLVPAVVTNSRLPLGSRMIAPTE